MGNKLWVLGFGFWVMMIDFLNVIITDLGE